MTSNRNENGKRPKFIVDFMLGRLAKWLRIFGYDTLYADKRFPENVILNSLKDNRVLVTRNTRLSRNRAWKLILIKSDQFLEQVGQVTGELKLQLLESRFFTRCTYCNSELRAVEDLNSIKDKVPEYVFKTQTKFTACPECGKVYWAGTHYDLLMKTLRKAGLVK